MNRYNDGVGLIDADSAQESKQIESSNKIAYGDADELRKNEVDQDNMHVAVLGAGGVGKSAITLRFMRDVFVQKWEATIEDAYRRKVRVDNKTAHVQILDTAGQEDFSSLRAQWMMNKDGYIFVYSLLDKESLEHLQSFIDLIEQVSADLPRPPPVVFVGNKKDIVDREPEKRKVLKEDVEKLIKSYNKSIERVFPQQQGTGLTFLTEQIRQNEDQYNTIHFETSAFNNEKIPEVFDYIIREIRKNRSPTVDVESDCLGAFCTCM